MENEMRVSEAATGCSAPAWYQDISLEHAESYIAENMRAAARNVIAIGYYLKCIRDNQLYADAGYQNIWDYAREKYGFSASTASRYMSRNDKFSKGGNSPIMDERYREYNKSQLQEMLSLDEEQLERVTPDMTAREIRELKRPREIPYYEIPGKEEMEDIPGVVPQSVATSQEPVVADERQAAEPECILEPAAEMQQNEENCCENSSVEETQQEEPENIIDAEFSEAETELAEEAVSDLALLKDLLGSKKRLLESNLRIPGIEADDIHIRRQKLEVAALASMLYELEDMEEKPEQSAETKPPELPVFRNNEERKDWLNNYAAWGLWYEDEHIGVKYYKYDFPDGTCLIVDEYESILPGGREYKTSYMHLVGGPKERPKTAYGASKWPYHDRYDRYPDNMTDMVEFLKDLQKRQKK